MLNLPLKLTLAEFVENHWQKRPLMMTQALSVPDVITAEELAGLACETEVESRIVEERGRNGPWQVTHGPFSQEDFSRLPDSHWTLLVQDVDKLVPGVADILSHFRFLPDWRIDDVMISYAEDQGSVGPHTDDYDVFLIQATGKRRWQIEDRTDYDRELIPGLDLRIMSNFQPTQEWVLEPGDVLYLPPGMPHWGVALGPCLTWSVGFRAPSAGEIAAAWLEHRMGSVKNPRYRDPNPEMVDHPGVVSAATINEARRLCNQLIDSDAKEFARWFAGFISEPKEHLAPLPAESAITHRQVRHKLDAGVVLTRTPGARILLHRSEDELMLAASGELHELPISQEKLATALADKLELSLADLLPGIASEDGINIIVTLISEGQLEFADEPS